MTTLGADDDTSSFLERVLERVPGLNLLAVYDRDAVLIAKGTPLRVPPFAHSASCSLRARCRRQCLPCGRLCSPLRAGSLRCDLIVCTHRLCPSQAAKLQFGKNKHITAFYKDRTVVHINCLPLVISAVAAPNANIGLLLSMQQVRRPQSGLRIHGAIERVLTRARTSGQRWSRCGKWWRRPQRTTRSKRALCHAHTYSLSNFTHQRHSTLRRSTLYGARRWAGTRAAGVPLC